eukprot:TRINITY_DN52184_c0_g1_i1.p1 TRINITY_DN52184_c0_g1~~TRINITY_DN52184_c0_g1_i1.p1  ORF type:complete len:359 (+),score=33.11 TRINITY_DN52184_c0_g1_i1:37-1113(+)
MKKKLLIDTDGGGDDAIALLIGLNATLNQGVAELDAITTCWGNVPLPQVNINIAKLLDFYDAPDIPIIKGADGPLLGKKEVVEWDGHGKDGFGDADFPMSNRKIHTEKHAAQYMVEVFNNLKDDEVLQVITLGPLTNLALAFRLDGELPQKLKRNPPGFPGLVVMGGAIEGKGNSSMVAEFNIHSDPEAAFIVFHSMGDIPLHLVSWEVSLTCPMPWHWFDEWVGKNLPPECRTRVQVFIDKVMGAYQRLYREGAKDSDECVVADAVAVAVALYPEFTSASMTTHVACELGGVFSRGALCVDWYSKEDKPKNTTIVTRVNTSMFLRILGRIVTDHPTAKGLNWDKSGDALEGTEEQSF